MLIVLALLAIGRSRPGRSVLDAFTTALDSD